MRSIREILRRKLELKLTHREVARATGTSLGTVGALMVRWSKMGLSWEEVEYLTDEQLELRINGPRLPSTAARPMPDMLELLTELKRPGVTLELLHIEYLEKHPEDGYRYSRFCELYERWLKRQRLSMRQVHRAGEKFFIDYSGKTLQVVDPVNAEVRDAELYVGVMGASNYLYAEATWTQKVLDFVGSTTRALFSTRQERPTSALQN